MTNKEKLSEALQNFKTKYSNVTSGDLQTFIIGWQEAVNNLSIIGVSGSYSPTSEEVQKMYDFLKMYFYRSQMNGLIDIDPDERDEIKKILRFSDNTELNNNTKD